MNKRSEIWEEEEFWTRKQENGSGAVPSVEDGEKDGEEEKDNGDDDNENEQSRTKKQVKRKKMQVMGKLQVQGQCRKMDKGNEEDTFGGRTRKEGPSKSKKKKGGANNWMAPEDTPNLPNVQFGRLINLSIYPIRLTVLFLHFSPPTIVFEQADNKRSDGWD